MDNNSKSTQFHLIYLIEFSTGSVYIGQTRKSIEERMKYHLLLDCTVNRYIRKNNCTFEISALTEKNIKSNAVADIENKFIDKYKSKGINILNSAKGGSLGADARVWSLKKIHNEALKYNRRKDFEI